jgi:hypothetical protein
MAPQAWYQVANADDAVVDVSAVPFQVVRG